MANAYCNLHLLATVGAQAAISQNENSQLASNQQLPSMRQQHDDASSDDDALPSIFDVDVRLISNLHTRQGRERAARVCTI